MTDTLVHRGPDGQGFFYNSMQADFAAVDSELHTIEGPGTVVLGHRRLSIIDLEGGHQPLANEDSRVWVTYNGEIYNFEEIRGDLDKLGHRFRTDCDTEIIVHAWEEWGEHCVHRFRGMFAFALWDSRLETLFLARDRLGIKPLYYFFDKTRLVFGSEIKAILAAGNIPRRIDNRAFFDYLNLLYVPAPQSIFRDIKKLPAGHYCVVKRGRVAPPVQYWDLSFAEVNTHLSEAEWSEKIIDKLSEAIRIRMVSDVPLGAFLSGGVDSSTVVALMSALIDEPIKTSSIGFREDAFNELQYAEQVVKLYHTDHYQQIMDADAVSLLEQLVWYYDEPFADSSAIPTYLVSRMTRNRVTVALSGDGGDENFAGYRRYSFDLLENRLRNWIPAGIRSTFIAALARLYPKADWLPQVLRAKTLLSNLVLSPVAGYYNSMSWFGRYRDTILSDDLRISLQEYSPLQRFEEYGESCNSDDPLSRVQYIDIKTYLVDDILTKVDRASMANSLEVRVPLLDHEFMELAAQIPSSLKLKGREGKYILKKSMEPYLSSKILYRKKMGFSIPLAQWLRGDLQELFADKIFSSNTVLQDYLNIKTVREMWQKHQAKTSDFTSEMWAVLFFSMWAERFLEGEKP